MENVIEMYYNQMGNEIEMAHDFYEVIITWLYVFL